MSNDEEQQRFVGVREGAVAPYLGKPQQPRHSREGGNPVLSFGDLTELKVDQAGPAQCDEFVYVDISSVDNKLKRIVEPKTLPFEKAPSRARQRLRSGDVLVSMTRPNLNAVAIVPPELHGSIGSTGFHVMRAFEGTEPRWLFHAVQSADFIAAMSALVQGALYPAVRPKDIRAFELEVPSLDEQRRIVAELEIQLTRLDASVTALKRVQANLKHYRASVLKAACEGRLVPTEAALAHHTDRYESGSDLLARLLKEQRAAWKGRRKFREPVSVVEPTRRVLPAGWHWTTIDQLGDVGTGATPKRGKADYYEGGSIPWVTSGAVSDAFVRQASEFVTEKALSETNLTLYPAGTLLVAMYGEGKTRGKCSELLIAATTNQALAAIEAHSVIKPYLKVFLLMNYEETRKAASGGVQPNLNLSLIRSIAVPLPPLAEQHRIVAEVERRLSVIERIEATVAANLKRAERLRQSVLSRAFASGGPRT